MSDYIPRQEHGAPFTLGTSADVIGGRLVIVSGAKTVAPATLDSAVVAGVAGTDAKSGDPVTVYPVSGGVHALVASAAIAAGARVVAAAAGKVATIGANSNPIGIALEAATNADDVIDVLFI